MLKIQYEISCHQIRKKNNYKDPIAGNYNKKKTKIKSIRSVMLWTLPIQGEL